MTRKQKTYGLVLDLPGAPPVPHTVQGFYGTFHPDRPTPVGGPGEPTYQQAKDASADPGCPLRMVEIETGDVSDLREAAAEDRKTERRGGPDKEE